MQGWSIAACCAFLSGRADSPDSLPGKSFVRTTISRNRLLLTWIQSPRPRSDKFLFVDRDGVINADREDFIKNWSEYRFCPDAPEALRRLKQHGINVILISNQSGLNRGIISWPDFWDIHLRMVQGIHQAGGDILAAFYCPHRPDEECTCRKPAPGMILAAGALFSIRMEATWFIGDRVSDLKAAESAGCRGILVARQQWGCGRRQDGPEGIEVRGFPDLASAVKGIFGDL